MAAQQPLFLGMVVPLAQPIAVLGLRRLARRSQLELQDWAISHDLLVSAITIWLAAMASFGTEGLSGLQQTNLGLSFVMGAVHGMASSRPVAWDTPLGPNARWQNANAPRHCHLIGTVYRGFVRVVLARTSCVRKLMSDVLEPPDQERGPTLPAPAPKGRPSQWRSALDIALVAVPLVFLLWALSVLVGSKALIAVAAGLLGATGVYLGAKKASTRHANAGARATTRDEILPPTAPSSAHRKIQPE